MGYIYKHTNKINGKVYIGQTTRNPQNRWSNGRGYTNDKRKLTSPFANAIIKYGWDNFKHEIICEVENDKLDELEKYYISFYKSNIKEFGYNCESGGNKNKKLSKETKEKLSKSHKGKGHCCSEETRKKLSILRTGKGNPMYGVRGEKHPNYGKKRPSFYKAVVMLDLNSNFIKEFDSIKDVTIYLNSIGVEAKGLSHISAVCKGKRKQTYGYKWMYKEDYYVTNTGS